MRERWGGSVEKMFNIQRSLERSILISAHEELMGDLDMCGTASR